MNTTTEHFEMPENSDRQYQPIDHSLVDAFPKVYIFSVDPAFHIVSKGGLGDFVIHEKKDGKRISEPLVVLGRHPEHVHLGTSSSPVNYIDGMLLAKDIVGVISQDTGLQRHTSNLEWHGVFITLNEEPTDQEIRAAEAKRKQYLERLVSDADQKYMRGQAQLIDSAERSAAHELHLKKTWAEKPTAMDSCPACGSAVVPNVAVCANCNAVLDEKKARKFFPERFKPKTQAAEKDEA